MDTFPTELPQNIIETAVDYYADSIASSDEITRQIRKWKYVQEHGPTTIETEDGNEMIQIELTIDEDCYMTTIPKSLEEPVEAEGKSFTDIQLLAVCLQTGFPWAEESYVAYYRGIENEDETSDRQIFLELCTPPREPRYTAQVMEEPMCFYLDKVSHTMKPNPWEFGSVTVVYENTQLAETFLGKSTDPEIYPSSEIGTRES